LAAAAALSVPAVAGAEPPPPPLRRGPGHQRGFAPVAAAEYAVNDGSMYAFTVGEIMRDEPRQR
jgi:hypothetical protein